MRPDLAPRTRAALVASLALALAALVGSCSSSEMIDTGSGGSSTSGGSGLLSVRLHDQVDPDITAVWVSFSAIAARSADDGTWLDLGVDADMPMNLLDHVGPDNALTLATSLVPGGVYDAVRVTIDEVEVELSSGPVTIPIPQGGTQVAVATAPFVVAADGSVTVVLDFLVDASFQVNGTSVDFDPAIQLTSVLTN